MLTPSVFYPFASELSFKNVLRELGAIRYRFGAVSLNPDLPIWVGEIEPDSEPVQTAFASLKQHTDDRFDLLGCHLNLQTQGLDGAFHMDAGPAMTHALIWYVHPYDWPQEFGGYFLVGADPHCLRAILPSRNLAVLIAASDPHCAMSPLVYARGKARISLALNLRWTDAHD
jgi:hypothetical protein